MRTLLPDIRYALRTWTRTPGVTLVALLTLALGIGANTTIFSIIDATLLRPLDFPEPDRLMSIWKGRIDDPKSHGIISMPNYRDMAGRSSSWQALAIFDSAGRGYNLTDGVEPEQVSGVRVTASFFRVLGIEPMLGRAFLPEEETAGRDRVVVLSHGLWTRRFGADPAVVGRTIDIDASAYTVVGVMPPEFHFQFWSGRRELWVPAGWTEGDQDPSSNSFVAIGRLKPDVSPEQARAEMETVGRALVALYPNSRPDLTLRVVPISTYGTEDLRAAMQVLLGVVGFVLLIACANVANIMLARATARQREFAIRGALGASRSRIVTQLLTESVLLSAAGGLCGLLVSVWATGLLVPILPGNVMMLPLRSVDDFGVSWSILAFTLAVSLLSGVLFGLAPAWSAFRGNLTEPLNDQARGSTPGARARLRHALVASEIALTVVILAGAGVMILSLARLLDISPGLDPRNVLVMSISQPQSDLYYGPPDNPRFCQGLTEVVGGLAGVRSVSGIAHLPLSGGGAGRAIAIEGQPAPDPANLPSAAYTVACPDSLGALGIPLVSGRDFTARDATSAPHVALVNERFARRFWPNEDAVGRRFKIGGMASDNPWMTVVGVFRDVRHWGLHAETRPAFIRPFPQAGWPWLTVVVKTETAPLTFAEPVRKALLIVDPHQPAGSPQTMEQVIERSVSGRRFPMLLVTTFGALALLLAAVGIAGVVGYSVAQRTQEIGVRVALGAQSGDVMRLIMGHTMRWAAAGLVVGLAGAYAVLRVLVSQLHGVEAADPLVLGGVSVLLLIVAIAAAYVPARRVLGVDPVTALRCG
jgi:predicted permease